MLSAKNIKNIFLGESLKIKKKRICVFIIASIILLQSKVISSYVEKINLKVTAQIAKPILVVNHDEKIVGNYSDIKNVPDGVSCTPFCPVTQLDCITIFPFLKKYTLCEDLSTSIYVFPILL